MVFVAFTQHCIQSNVTHVTHFRGVKGVLYSVYSGLSPLPGGCCDMDQSDTIGKIELIPLSVLSSLITNYKNDIQYDCLNDSLTE